MPPKKTTDGASATTTKAKAPSTHGSYQDMIKEAIIALKARQGSSRQALKKYVKANNDINTTSDKQFDSLFNKALKTGVTKGVFEQPKGASGGTKLAKTAKDEVKKESKAKPAAAKKEGAATAKKPAVKKAAPKKEGAAPAPKKAAATKKAPVKKAAVTKKAPAKKAAKTADAPAVVDKPTVTNKTASGRITKTTKAEPKKKAAAPKKKAAAPKKEKTPKKAAAEPVAA